MVSKGIHKVGLQIISEAAKPIALCALTGSKADRELRPAFIMDNNSKQRSIIAEKGLYMANREMEIKNEGERELIVADDLNESNLSYEVFKYTKK